MVDLVAMTDRLDDIPQLGAVWIVTELGRTKPLCAKCLTTLNVAVSAQTMQTKSRYCMTQ